MTLEKLIETLRGIDGPVTLDETHVRELVSWFETARNSIASPRLNVALAFADEHAAAIAKAVENERNACARAADSYGAHDVARVIRGWGGR